MSNLLKFPSAKTYREKYSRMVTGDLIADLLDWHDKIRHNIIIKREVFQGIALMGELLTRPISPAMSNMVYGYKKMLERRLESK